MDSAWTSNRRSGQISEHKKATGQWDFIVQQTDLTMKQMEQIEKSDLKAVSKQNSHNTNTTIKMITK